MSHRYTVTTQYASGSGTSERTNHSGEILAMRMASAAITAQYPDVNACPDEKRKDAVLLETGAALLEVHDDTGVSLDDWIGPLECVLEALFLIGKDRDDFLPNGV